MDNVEDEFFENNSEIIIYQFENGNTHIEVRLEDSTVWLSQKMIANLYQKDVRTINEHIKTIFDEHELAPDSTIRKFRIVQTEGNRIDPDDEFDWNIEQLQKRIEKKQ